MSLHNISAFNILPKAFLIVLIEKHLEDHFKLILKLTDSKQTIKIYFFEILKMSSTTCKRSDIPNGQKPCTCQCTLNING